MEINSNPETFYRLVTMMATGAGRSAATASRREVHYHANCTDGITAAMVAEHSLASTGVNVRSSGKYHSYHPEHFAPIAVRPRTSHLYVVDFSYPLRHYAELTARDRDLKVVQLDHHSGAAQEWETDWAKLDDEERSRINQQVAYTYSEKESGALMAWLFFHKEPPPLFVQYVSDRDLWNFHLPHSREVNAYIRNLPPSATAYLSHAILMERDNPNQRNSYFQEVLTIGSSLLAMVDRVVASCLQQSWLHTMEIEGIPHDVYAACAPPIVRSEVGDALLGRERSDLAAYYFPLKNGSFRIGFRSKKGTGLALSAARGCGGSGHGDAAGATVSVLPWVSQ